MPVGATRIARMGGGHRGRLLGLWLIAAAWLAVVPPGASADQIACGQVLKASTTITNSLAGCSGDGLVVGAGGIDVNLNGQTIAGTGLGAGVRNNGHDDVTIRNGALLNFDYGVVLSPGTDPQRGDWAQAGAERVGGHPAQRRVAQQREPQPLVGLHRLRHPPDQRILEQRRRGQHRRRRRRRALRIGAWVEPQLARGQQRADEQRPCRARAGVEQHHDPGQQARGQLRRGRQGDRGAGHRRAGEQDHVGRRRCGPARGSYDRRRAIQRAR